MREGAIRHLPYSLAFLEAITTFRGEGHGDWRVGAPYRPLLGHTSHEDLSLAILLLPLEPERCVERPTSKYRISRWRSYLRAHVEALLPGPSSLKERHNTNISHEPFFFLFFCLSATLAHVTPCQFPILPPITM
jgi:hypothetical protein